MATDPITTAEEVWEPITGYDGKYLVSNLGRVWTRGRGKKGAGHLLALEKNCRGYIQVGLTNPQTRKQNKTTVHRLVLQAFVGDSPSGHETGHKNGRRDDNRLSNLGWISSAENKADQKRHGTARTGFRHTHVVLTPEKVREVRAKRGEGWLWADIARSISVSVNTARSAGIGITFSDFEPETICEATRSPRRFHKAPV